MINYLKQIEPTEYVVFVDLDNINNKITKKRIESCFQKKNLSKIKKLKLPGIIIKKPEDVMSEINMIIF